MKAVIFDMDGVIIDSERIVNEAWQKVGPKYAMKEIDELYRRTVGINKQATAKLLTDTFGDDFPVDEFFADTRKEFYDYIEKYGLPKKKGIDELLEYLKKKGYKIGIASSTRVSSVKEEMKMIGLYDYFDYIVGGDMVRESKPNPEIFIKCMEGLSGTSADTWVIEDSYNGIRAAKRANIKAIMVPDMLAPDDEMKDIAYAIKDDLYGVMDILSQSEKTPSS